MKSRFLRDALPEDALREGSMNLVGRPQATINVTHSLFVRTRPTVSSSIRSILFSGDTVAVLDRIGNWVEIATEGFHGFINQGYLS